MENTYLDDELFFWYRISEQLKLPLTDNISVLYASVTSEITKLVEKNDKFIAFFWDEPNLYHMQCVSTHNSFHKPLSISSLFIKQWNYEHPDILTQLEDGVCGIELDLHYSKRTKRWIVYHILFDHGTTCRCLVDCLQIIKDFINYNSIPIVIMLQVGQEYDISKFCSWGSAQEIFDNLEKEILSVFDYDDIFFPKQMQGSYPTIQQALNERGWPSFNKLKGKVYFVYIGRKICHDIYLLRDEKMFFVEVGFLERFYTERSIYLEARYEVELRNVQKEKFIVKCCDYKGYTCKDKGAHYIHTNDYTLHKNLIRCNPVTSINITTCLL